MHRGTVQQVMVVAGILASAGCGGINSAVRTIKGDGQKPVTADFSATDADGSWQAACQPVNSVQNGYLSATMEITGADVTRDATYWSDATCKTPVLAVHQAGDLTVGDARDTDHRQVSIANLTTVLTPSDAGETSTLNAKAYCGHSDWTLGKALDVTPTVCDTLSSSITRTVTLVQVQTTATPALLVFFDDRSGDDATGPGDEYQKAK